MATAIPVQYTDSKYHAKLEDFAWTAADAAGMSFANNGKSRIFVVNVSGVKAYPNLIAVDDPYSRGFYHVLATNNTFMSIAGPFPIGIWNQSDGTVTMVIPDATGLSFAVISDI